MGLKLPGSAVSTAPKELRQVDLSTKMSKSKKKKLKKRAKQNLGLMQETLDDINCEHQILEQVMMENVLSLFLQAVVWLQ